MVSYGGLSWNKYKHWEQSIVIKHKAQIGKVRKMLNWLISLMISCFFKWSFFLIVYWLLRKSSFYILIRNMSLGGGGWQTFSSISCLQTKFLPKKDPPDCSVVLLQLLATLPAHYHRLLLRCGSDARVVTKFRLAIVNRKEPILWVIS